MKGWGLDSSPLVARAWHLTAGLWDGARGLDESLCFLKGGVGALGREATWRSQRWRLLPAGFWVRREGWFWVASV